MISLILLLGALVGAVPPPADFTSTTSQVPLDQPFPIADNSPNNNKNGGTNPNAPNINNAGNTNNQGNNQGSLYYPFAPCALSALYLANSNAYPGFSGFHFGGSQGSSGNYPAQNFQYPSGNFFSPSSQYQYEFGGNQLYPSVYVLALGSDQYPYYQNYQYGFGNDQRYAQYGSAGFVNTASYNKNPYLSNAVKGPSKTPFIYTHSSAVAQAQ